MPGDFSVTQPTAPGCETTANAASNRPSVRDLRRLWKPAKERLGKQDPNHPTAVRVHRAFSWMARVEQFTDSDDSDLSLICRWIAFNALYGQWNERTREPMPDRDSWRSFLDRVLDLDREHRLCHALVTNKRLAMALLEDEYLSSFFWKEPTSGRASKVRRTKFEAHTWFIEQRWTVILDHLIERIYLMRCQLMHGAATLGGKLNRDSLRRSSLMLGHLLDAVVLIIVRHGADEDWGVMCYPPLRATSSRPR